MSVLQEIVAMPDGLSKNLLDKVYVTNNGNLGNDRAYYVAYTLNH